MVATIAQAIWMRQNELVHGKEFTHPLQLIQIAIENQEAFQGPPRVS